MRIGGLLALGPFLAAPGCGDASSGAPNADVDVEVRVGDLRVVAGEALFTGVRDVAATPEGIWVLDGGEPYVTWVDNNGAIGARFGRKGRGPAELIDPRAIQTAAGAASPDLLVWDPGNARVTRFGPDGNPVSTMRPDDGHGAIRADITDVTYADPFRIRRVGALFAFARYPAGLSRPADLARGRLALAAGPDLRGGAPVAGLDGAPAYGGADGPGELGALPLWDGCPDGELVLWLPGREHLTWLDTGGTVTLSVGVPNEPRPLTDRDVESYLRLMARLETGDDPESTGIDIAAMARTLRDRFAREAPVATGLRCGPGREGWLRLFDTSSDPLGRARDWLVVRSTGVRRVRMPETFSPLIILADRVVGVLERPEGQRLAWWPRAASGTSSPSNPTQERSP
ncbi:MAG TPA: hypothetical protein VK849_12575 [Longimicrobiales bacterium]|nr:hypothetical protein [Longimicrobiales bacterium]